jgi:hypothetical protein
MLTSPRPTVGASGIPTAAHGKITPAPKISPAVNPALGNYTPQLAAGVRDVADRKRR